MKLDPNRTDLIHLRAGGTSLIVQTPNERPPEVIAWGADLGPLSARALHGLSTAVEPPLVGNSPDRRVHPGLIPLSSTGWMGRPGLVGHRPSGASSWAPRLHTDAAELSAADIETLEPPQSPEVAAAPATTDAARGQIASAGPGVIHFDLSDPAAQISVGVDLELLPAGLVRVRARLTNTGADDYQLDELSIALPLPLRASEILDFSGQWGREREPQRLPVRPGVHLHEGRHGRTGFDAPMMMYCGEPGFGFERGEVFGLHVAHSGNHRTWIERCNNGLQVMGGGELLLPGEVQLTAEQSYTSPWIYAQRADGLDAAARRLHRWQRSLPAHPDAARPVTLNVWEAVHFDHSLPGLLRLADLAASVGVERYVLDDGWFLGRRDDRAGLGDWQEDPQVWPEGMHPLVDRVHELGMQFGLWVEPEMINVDSRLARDHPDWILRAGPELPVEWRHQQVLDLTIPQAWEHVRTRLDALITRYGIAYFKWDHNRDLIDAGDPARGGRPVVGAQTRACYALMDRLRDDHPGFEIESCSSGGGRIDLEMIRHTQRFWLSDCIDPHERQSIMRWSEQLVAPEYMGTHVASRRSQTTGRIFDLPFRAATALWGHMGFELDLRELGDTELTQLRRWVQFYKDHRQLLLTGDLVRRDVADGSMWLHGVVAPDRSQALYELTTRRRPALSPRGLVTIPGLAPDREYRIRPVLVGEEPAGLQLPPWGEQGVAMSGAALAGIGVQAPALFPDQALIIEVREAGSTACGHGNDAE